MLTVQEIKSFIDNDWGSEKKKQARTGQRYYDGEHDIMNKRIFFVNADGKLEEDKFKVNTKISHPFFRELADQTVQHLYSGKDGFIKAKDQELQKELDERFNNNDRFKAELQETTRDCVIKGFGFMYRFKGADGRNVYKSADSMGVVEVRSDETEDGCDYLIYHYVDRIDKESREIKKIRVWDKNQVYFYTLVDDGEVVKDENAKINPRPHTMYKKKGSNKLFKDNYGEIPFYRLDNNIKQQSDLNIIKDIIDDYDNISCGLSNNIEDTNEALYVVKGFEGDDLDELMKNIKAKKHIGVAEDGGVDIKTVDIPYQARQARLELHEKNIFRFACGVNTADLKDSTATVSVAIQMAYYLLDMKVNKLETNVKQILHSIVDAEIADINKEKGTDYKIADVKFEFNREYPANMQEMAQIKLTEAQTRQTEINTLLSIATKLDNETLMERICLQLEIDYEEIKDKLPPPEEMNDPYQASSLLNTLPTEPDDGGDVIAE